MSYIKLNNQEFDADVLISDYEEYFNVLDGENAGRSLGRGRMIRDIIGTFIGHKITMHRRGTHYAGLDELWDFLIAHSIDDSVLLEAADGQSSIRYEAYYTSGRRKLESVDDRGTRYWNEIEVNFIPVEAQLAGAGATEDEEEDNG